MLALCKTLRHSSAAKWKQTVKRIHDADLDHRHTASYFIYCLLLQYYSNIHIPPPFAGSKNHHRYRLLLPPITIFLLTHMSYYDEPPPFAGSNKLSTNGCSIGPHRREDYLRTKETENILLAAHKNCTYKIVLTLKN